MDERTKELIAVGASVTAHCLPCLQHHIDQAVAQGISVDRFNLGQEPQVFVENAQVKAPLAQEGPQKLPFVYINGERVFSGRYPEAAELLASLGLQPGETPPDVAPQSAMPMAAMPGADADGCCPPGRGVRLQKKGCPQRQRSALSPAVRVAAGSAVNGFHAVFSHHAAAFFGEDEINQLLRRTGGLTLGDK